MIPKILVLGFLFIAISSQSLSYGNAENSNQDLVDKIIRDLQNKQEQYQDNKRDEVKAQDDSINSINLAEDTNHQNDGTDQAKTNTKDTNPNPKQEEKEKLQKGIQGEAAAIQHRPEKEESFINKRDFKFLLIIAAVGCVSLVSMIVAGVCYFKARKSAKAASDVEYPAYGVTGPMKERIPSPGDRKLAQSAQMYHYQHQKQQMIAMEKANGDMKHDASDDDSDDDNVEGDYTVYECPGLAPTGEMEVKNPLFRGDETPVTPNNPPNSGGADQDNKESSHL